MRLIARVLPGDGVGLSGDVPLPLPERLHELVAARVAALSERTRDGLLAVAMLSRVSASALPATFDSPQEMEAALAEAVDADVIVDDETGVRFTHPLLASAVYALASQTRRHPMRRRLADIVSDPEEQARHAAHAATGPDEAAALRSRARRGARAAARRSGRRNGSLSGGGALPLPPLERRGPPPARRVAAQRLEPVTPPGHAGLADIALDQRNRRQRTSPRRTSCWPRSPGW